MALMLFKAPAGFADANVHKLSGVGVPGGDGSFQDASPIGSEYNDSQTGVKYMKIGAVNAPSDWVALSTVTENSNLQSQINTNATSISTEVTNRQSAIASETSARTAADSAIQAELDATEAGAGLSVTGAYVVDAAGHYISTATSLHNASQLLDAQLFSTDGKAVQNAADIANLSATVSTQNTTTSNASAAIQAELDAAEAGAGLSVTGAYVVDAAANYIGAATSLHNATQLLDAKLFATDAVATAAIPAAEKAAANGVATLDASGLIIPSQLPPLAISSTTLVPDEPSMLALNVQAGDIAVRTDLSKSFIHNGGTAGTIADWTELLTPTDPAMASELNAVEAGAGLSTIGAYVPAAAANYISGAVSLHDATVLLDTQVAVVDGKAVQNAADIATLSAAHAADKTATQSAQATMQGEIDAIEAGAGLSIAGAYVPDTAGSYIGTAVSLHNATQLLDTQVAANAGLIASNETANAAAHASFTGIMGDGAYTSTNNIVAGDTLTAAVSKLDSALSGTITTVSSAGVLNAVVDAVNTKVDTAVEWNIVVSDSVTPSNRLAFKIFASHDGDPVNDATFFDWNEYSELELGAPIAGFGFSVAVNGVGAAQVMELSVASTNAVDVKVTRVTV